MHRFFSVAIVVFAAAIVWWAYSDDDSSSFDAETSSRLTDDPRSRSVPERHRGIEPASQAGGDLDDGAEVVANNDGEMVVIRVTDSNDNPVEGAHVSIIATETSSDIIDVESVEAFDNTDEQGHVEVDSRELTKGTYIVARRTGVGLVIKEWNGGSDTVRLPGFPDLLGTVVDKVTRQSVAGADVTFSSFRFERTQFRRTSTTNAEGRFSCPFSRWQSIEINAPGYATFIGIVGSHSDNAEYELSRGRRLGLRFVASPPPSETETSTPSIDFRVTMPNGRVIHGNGRLDEDIWLDNVSRETRQIYVSVDSPRYTVNYTDVATNSSRGAHDGIPFDLSRNEGHVITVPLVVRPLLRGRVIDDVGRGVSGVTIIAFPADEAFSGRDVGHTRRAETEHDGSFQLECPRGLRMWILVSGDTWIQVPEGWNRTTVISLAEQRRFFHETRTTGIPVEDEVTIRVTRSATIRGTVRGAAGLPVAGALVRIASSHRDARPDILRAIGIAEDRALRRTTTDKLGCFVLTGVVPRSWDRRHRSRRRFRGPTNHRRDVGRNRRLRY